MWKLVEKRFKEQTKLWLAKPGNFDRHVDFLEHRVLGRFSDSYDKAELAEALETFKGDQDAGVERIFDALKAALDQKLQFEMQKGQRILNAHRGGSREMKDLGNARVIVPSRTTTARHTLWI